MKPSRFLRSLPTDGARPGSGRPGARAVNARYLHLDTEHLRETELESRRAWRGAFLDVLEADAAELDAAAQRGELTDAKTLIGLFWLQNWRAGRWSLAWQAAPKTALPIMQP